MYVFHFQFSLPSRSEQFSGANANEMKHDRLPVVIVVLDPQNPPISHTMSCILFSRSIALRQQHSSNERVVLLVSTITFSVNCKICTENQLSHDFPIHKAIS